MPLPENDSDPAKSQLAHTTLACAQLKQCATEHCASSHRRDAFCTFLKTHICICDRESRGNRSERLKRLNHNFAREMVEVYAIFKDRKNRVEDLPYPWVKAFNAYQDKSNRLTVLALMAAAHILGDLEGVLFFVDVTKEEYDQVYEDIVDCVSEVEKLERETFRERLYGAMQATLDPLQNCSVWAMREIAWHKMQERKRLRDS